MDYIDFVEQVVQTFVRLDDGGKDIIGPEHVASELGLSERDEGLYHALEDLASMGIVGLEPYYWIKPTPNTDKIRHQGLSLRDIWPQVVGTFLAPDQAQFLAELVEAAHRPGERSASLTMVEIGEVYESLGWSLEKPDAYRVTQALEQHGFLRAFKATGYSINLRPTYAGAVRATQQVATKWQARLAELLSEGETSTVDVKRELSLNGERAKGEFVRDVLGLATTKASGRERHLVIGFDDATLDFVQSVDPEITRDRLEQVINAYTDPKPEVDWVTVPVAGGTAGVVVVRRDPLRVPYRVSKRIWKLTEGNVYVRHGTHTEPPTPAELEALEGEGRRARASSA